MCDDATPDELLAALYHLRRNGPTSLPGSSVGGICWHVEQYLSEHGRKCASNDMPCLFESWPKFTGDFCYPVPTKEVRSEYGFNEHHRAGTLWEGEQGELRYELIDHMIRELESGKY